MAHPVVLRGRVVRQRATELAVDVHGEAGAVEPVRAGGTVGVRVALVLSRDADRALPEGPGARELDARVDDVLPGVVQPDSGRPSSAAMDIPPDARPPVGARADVADVVPAVLARPPLVEPDDRAAGMGVVGEAGEDPGVGTAGQGAVA